MGGENGVDVLRYRQLGREGQAEKDDGYRPHATHEGGTSTLQEWLPDRCAKGCERTWWREGLIEGKQREVREG